MQDLPLGILIDWISGKPIPKKKTSLVCYPNDWKIPLINESEKLILHELRGIRNDMSHRPYLTYDSNIKKEVVRSIINNVRQIHNKLVEEIMKISKNS